MSKFSQKCQILTSFQGKRLSPADWMISLIGTINIGNVSVWFRLFARTWSRRPKANSRRQAPLEASFIVCKGMFLGGSEIFAFLDIGKFRNPKIKTKTLFVFWNFGRWEAPQGFLRFLFVWTFEVLKFQKKTNNQTNKSFSTSCCNFGLWKSL